MKKLLEEILFEARRTGLKTGVLVYSDDYGYGEVIKTRGDEEGNKDGDLWALVDWDDHGTLEPVYYDTLEIVKSRKNRR